MFKTTFSNFDLSRYVILIFKALTICATTNKKLHWNYSLHNHFNWLVPCKQNIITLSFEIIKFLYFLIVSSFIGKASLRCSINLCATNPSSSNQTLWPLSRTLREFPTEFVNMNMCSKLINSDQTSQRMKLFGFCFIFYYVQSTYR